ncbi:hypothetical protein [Streptomyces erythrochromogenes]|uniref:hypothetical protein n=1 Tax=Streptomyces erythrochromogenes TaxID=285574 RepID=UPI0033CFAD0C
MKQQGHLDDSVWDYMLVSVDLTGLGSDPAAIVYTEPKFAGRSQHLGPGRYDTVDLRIPNDSISSVAVPKGLKVTLFEHSGFRGASAVIKADTGDLGASSFDNTASSVTVEKI